MEAKAPFKEFVGGLARFRKVSWRIAPAIKWQFHFTHQTVHLADQAWGFKRECIFKQRFFCMMLIVFCWSIPPECQPWMRKPRAVEYLIGYPQSFMSHLNFDSASRRRTCQSISYLPVVPQKAVVRRCPIHRTPRFRDPVDHRWPNPLDQWLQWLKWPPFPSPHPLLSTAVVWCNVISVE